MWKRAVELASTKLAPTKLPLDLGERYMNLRSLHVPSHQELGLVSTLRKGTSKVDVESILPLTNLADQPPNGDDTGHLCLGSAAKLVRPEGA